jgi:general secretion pathway protein A
MTPQYRLFFELQSEPFGADIALEHILVTESLKALEQRVHYAMRTGAVALGTGEIGSGKSTALRYIAESLHPAEYLCLYVTATTDSILELYRQIVAALDATIAVLNAGAIQSVYPCQIQCEISIPTLFNLSNQPFNQLS